jgi:hypothetical protein
MLNELSIELRVALTCGGGEFTLMGATEIRPPVLASHDIQIQFASIISRTLLAKSIIPNGFAITCIPGSRCPFPTVAFSA